MRASRTRSSTASANVMRPVAISASITTRQARQTWSLRRMRRTSGAARKPWRSIISSQ